MIKIPKELEREVETWRVDLPPLFLTFLRHEFDKIKRFESAVKESKSGSELKMQKVVEVFTRQGWKWGIHG